MVKKKLLTWEMREAERPERLKNPQRRTNRKSRPAGEHPAGCLCRTCSEPRPPEEE